MPGYIHSIFQWHVVTNVHEKRCVEEEEEEEKKRCDKNKITIYQSHSDVSILSTYHHTTWWIL